MKCWLNSSKELMKMNISKKIRIQNKTQICIKTRITNHNIVLKLKSRSMIRPSKPKLTIVLTLNLWTSKILLRWKSLKSSKLLCNRFKPLKFQRIILEVSLMKICKIIWNHKKSIILLLIMNQFRDDSTIKGTLASMSIKPNTMIEPHLYVTIRN